MALGRNSAVGLGEESTYGTSVARSNWRPVASSALSCTDSKARIPDLYGSSSAAMSRRHFIERTEAGGSFSLICTYDNMGMILKHLLGNASSSGAGPTYTHTYTLASTLPTGLTIENIRGTATNSETFEGCKLDSGTFRISAGQTMTAELSVIAEDSNVGTGRAAAGSPSYAADDNAVLHHHAGELSFNGQNYPLIDLTLTVNNGLERRYFMGSKLTQEPNRQGFCEVQLQFTVEANDALAEAQVDDTQSDASITFTNGARQFGITVQNAYISDQTDSISDAGVTRQSITMMAESDGTDDGLSIVVINENASATAN